jgi:hypothetical protein
LKMDDIKKQTFLTQNHAQNGHGDRVVHVGLVISGRYVHKGHGRGENNDDDHGQQHGQGHSS